MLGYLFSFIPVGDKMTWSLYYSISQSLERWNVSGIRLSSFSQGVLQENATAGVRPLALTAAGRIRSPFLKRDLGGTSLHPPQKSSYMIHTITVLMRLAFRLSN